MAIDMTCRIGTLTLETPIIAASGCFGYGTEYSELCDLNQFGAIVTKTITPQPRMGNAIPRIWETPNGGMLNSIGLANVGIDRYVVEKLPELRKLPCKVIVSIAGNTVEEYQSIVAKLEPHDAWHAIELNISCPNVKEGGVSFGVDAQMTAQVVRACRQATCRPLIVKLTPMATSIATIAKVCESEGADGVSMINTIVGMAIDIHSRKPRIATVTGGYSGPPIKPAALARVWEVYQAVKIPVIGLGGIASSDDAIEFMLAGSTAIQVGTMIYAEPDIATELMNGVRRYCQQYNIAHVSELTGAMIVPGKGAANCFCGI